MWAARNRTKREVRGEGLSGRGAHEQARRVHRDRITRSGAAQIDRETPGGEAGFRSTNQTGGQRALGMDEVLALGRYRAGEGQRVRRRQKIRDDRLLHPGRALTPTLVAAPII